MTHLRTLILLLAAMLPVCCTDSAPAKLRIGLSAWPGYLDLAVADEHGFFAAEGLDVQLVEFASLHEIARAYQLGQIDVMTGTLIEVLEVSHGARPVEIAWIVDVSNGADVAVARGRHGDLPSSSGATTLRGAKIAYEPNSLGAYMLARMLSQQGLTENDIEPVGMDQMEMVEAMREQRIDVAITYPPTSIALLELPHTEVIFSSAQIPDEVVDAISIDPTLLDADPTLLDRFYAAMAKTETHVAHDPESAVAHKCLHLGVDRSCWDPVTAGIKAFRLADQYDWIWGSDRLDRALARLHPLIEQDHAPSDLRHLNLHVRHRAVPAALASPVPR